MTKAQLTADTNHQVQRNSQNDIAANGNQIAVDRPGQMTAVGQQLHHNIAHNHQGIGSHIGAVLF